MTPPKSSTALIEADSRHGAERSMGSERMARTVHLVPRSSQTLTASYTTWNVPFASTEDFETVPGKYASHGDSAVGIVTCQYIAQTGSLIVELPTKRFIAEYFQPTWLFGAPSVEWLSENDVVFLAGVAPVVTTIRVAGLDVAAQPIASRPGLLNSTDAVFGASRLVEAKFAEAVALAREEWFEDGVESKFSRALSTLVFGYGDAAIAAVESFVLSPSSNIEIAVEAAQWLGEVAHHESHRYRRTLLERLLLTAPSTRLRHGAAAGLAAMDEPSLLPVLLEARDRESNRRLRHYLELVVDQLERTRACLSS